MNKYSHIPLYMQLRDFIIDKIDKGEYLQDSKIPSEQELCELYDISRPTVRQAIAELCSSGHLYKQKGKGTFVSKPKFSIDVKNYSGFTDSILDSNIPGEKDIISIQIISNQDVKKLEEVFNVGSNQKTDFAEIRYTISGENEVFSYNTSYIPLDYFPNIVEDIREKKASYDVLRGKYPLIPTKSKSSLEVIFTEHSDAQFLKVQQGQALIKIENILYSKSGQAVEFVLSKYRADKSKLMFENAKHA